MTRDEQLQRLQRHYNDVMRQKKRASEVSAEYLVRQVPEEDLPRFVSQPRHEDGPEYVEPIRFIAGWVVVAAVAALIFWGV